MKVYEEFKIDCKEFGDCYWLCIKSGMIARKLYDKCFELEQRVNKIEEGIEETEKAFKIPEVREGLGSAIDEGDE